MSDKPSLATMPTPILKAIVGLCPEKPGESVTIKALGQSVTLTHESRRLGVEELERRGVKP